jgi:predicted amidohydrolase
MAALIRVSTIAWSAGRAGVDNLEDTHTKLRELLEHAAREEPDIVALTEFCNVHSGSEFPEQAQPIPGPTTELCSEIAREHNMYVVCALPERDGDVMYNTAAFVGRNGEIVGKYHKFQPTVGEMDKGIVPGSDAPAFDLDFGKVGAAICFDLKFVEVGQHLAENGCKLCIFSSMFVGGERLQHWARDFGMYVVSSVPAHSYIIDMSGRVLAETGSKIDQVQAGLVPPVASASINMDREFFHLDENQNKLPDIIDKYAGGIDVQIHPPEAFFTLASRMDETTVGDIISEFELEPWVDYLARARQARKTALGEDG